MGPQRERRRSPRRRAPPAEPLGAWPPAGRRADRRRLPLRPPRRARARLRPRLPGPRRPPGARARSSTPRSSLPEEQAGEAERFGLHPALLDAALHGDRPRAPSEARRSRALPFAWSGVSLHGGGRARSCGSRIVRRRGRAVSLRARRRRRRARSASVASLALRPLDPASCAGAGAPRPSGLLGARLDGGRAARAGAEAPSEVEALRCEAEPGAEAAEAARAARRGGLERDAGMARRRGRGRAAPGLRHRGAVAAARGRVPDPAAAAVWGLVRSAQSEHPGRFALIDSDGSEASEAALAAALPLGAEEPQLALREGVALAPRLAAPRAADEAERRAARPRAHRPDHRRHRRPRRARRPPPGRARTAPATCCW